MLAFSTMPGRPPTFADPYSSMPPPIRISTNQKDHIAAAKALSQLLDQFGVRHAFIGGFAWSLLGSSRATEMSIFSLSLSYCALIVPNIRHRCPHRKQQRFGSERQDRKTRQTIRHRRFKAIFCNTSTSQFPVLLHKPIMFHSFIRTDILSTTQKH